MWRLLILTSITIHTLKKHSDKNFYLILISLEEEVGPTLY